MTPSNKAARPRRPLGLRRRNYRNRSMPGRVNPFPIKIRVPNRIARNNNPPPNVPEPDS